MALIPLNTFKTKTAILTDVSTATVYVTPIGVTSIVLMAQVTNISTTTQFVTFSHYRNLPVLPDSQGNGAQPADTVTELVKDFAVPSGDAAAMTTGKLIVESLDSVRCSVTNSGTCKITLSILETANA